MSRQEIYTLRIYNSDMKCVKKIDIDLCDDDCLNIIKSIVTDYDHSLSFVFKSKHYNFVRILNFFRLSKKKYIFFGFKCITGHEAFEKLSKYREQLFKILDNE